MGLFCVYQVDEAKQELRDIVEFLKNPSKFSSLGGKLPKGMFKEYCVYYIYINIRTCI